MCGHGDGASPCASGRRSSLPTTVANAQSRYSRRRSQCDMLTNVCIAVYIAANRPLPTIDWDESHPAFYVATLGKDEEPVRNQFTKPHVYCAGSHEGCGCGFQLGKDRGPKDPEQARGRESLGAFSKYLEDALTRVDDLELFACWEGDQAARRRAPASPDPDGSAPRRFLFLGKGAVGSCVSRSRNPHGVGAAVPRLNRQSIDARAR